MEHFENPNPLMKRHPSDLTLKEVEKWKKKLLKKIKEIFSLENQLELRKASQSSSTDNNKIAEEETCKNKKERFNPNSFKSVCDIDINIWSQLSLDQQMKIARKSLYEEELAYIDPILRSLQELDLAKKERDVILAENLKLRSQNQGHFNDHDNVPSSFSKGGYPEQMLSPPQKLESSLLSSSKFKSDTATSLNENRSKCILQPHFQGRMIPNGD